MPIQQKIIPACSIRLSYENHGTMTPFPAQIFRLFMPLFCLLFCSQDAFFLNSRRHAWESLLALGNSWIAIIISRIPFQADNAGYRYCTPHHRVHRVITSAFWLTFSHEGKISLAGGVGGARPPPFITFTITSKVAVYAPVEWADTLTLFHFY